MRRAGALRGLANSKGAAPKGWSAGSPDCGFDVVKATTDQKSFTPRPPLAVTANRFIETCPRAAFNPGDQLERIEGAAHGVSGLRHRHRHAISVAQKAQTAGSLRRAADEERHPFFHHPLGHHANDDLLQRQFGELMPYLR